MPILLRIRQLSKKMGPTLDTTSLNQQVVEEMNRLGKFMIDELHSRIPPGQTKGAFPGDGPPTGKLKASFRRRKPYKSKSDSWTTTVFINREQVKKYWYVHEEGKTIRAKTKPYMKFDYRGKTIRTTRVTITPKWYMRDSVDATENEISLNAPKHIRNAIAVSVKLGEP